MAEGAPLLREYTGNRIAGSNPAVSATVLSELVLRLLLRAEFPLVLKGYSGKAIHLRQCQNAENRSLKADIL